MVLWYPVPAPRGAAVEVKMVTFIGAEGVPCVIRFEETKSATNLQRKFRTQYRKQPPSRPTIYT